VNAATGRIATARTFLVVPGDRPDRFGKAAASGADVVVLDLEDAVPPDRKQQARQHVSSWLDQQNQSVVRINAEGTPWHADDVAMIARHAGTVIAVMVPKAENPGQLKALTPRLPAGAGIIPLIETAAGIVRALDVCAATGVVRPLFGSLDLAAQLGVDHQAQDALRHARSALVLAAAASGRAAPIDGVTIASPMTGAFARTWIMRSLSASPANSAYTHARSPLPTSASLSDAELGWAREIVAAAQGRAVTVHDGHMIDPPVVLRARAIPQPCILDERRALRALEDADPGPVRGGARSTGPRSACKSCPRTPPAQRWKRYLTV
jgi:citrate lyase subunit beta / citryl-CoA lyase